VRAIFIPENPSPAYAVDFEIREASWRVLRCSVNGFHNSYSPKFDFEVVSAGWSGLPFLAKARKNVWDW
jgi:hypothetical protein